MEDFPLQFYVNNFRRDARDQKKDSRTAFELLRNIILDECADDFDKKTLLSVGNFKRIKHESCRDNLRLDNKTVFYVLLGYGQNAELFQEITKLFGNKRNENDAVYQMYSRLLKDRAKLEQALAVFDTRLQDKESPFRAAYKRYQRSEQISVTAAFDKIKKAISKQNSSDFAKTAHLSPVTLSQIDERNHRFDYRTVFKIALACNLDTKWFKDVEELFGRVSDTNRAEYRLIKRLLRKKCSFCQAKAVFEACGLPPL